MASQKPAATSTSEARRIVFSRAETSTGRTASGANCADSSSTSVVPAAISLSAPPITPARATGPSASAITHIWSVSE